MATSASSSASYLPFDFSPHLNQDVELLKQLGFIPGLKELLMLRQVHALEHATVWVLSEASHRPNSPRTFPFGAAELLGGMSTDQGFYLYGTANRVELQWAVHTALRRLVEGEWDLAVHPRCGTNLSVTMVLAAGLALGINLILPKGPIEQLIGLGIAAATAAQIAPDVGSVVQQHVTTAIPFNLAVDEISSGCDHWGRPFHFVRVHWIE
jgi:hypothetical protein